MILNPTSDIWSFEILKEFQVGLNIEHFEHIRSLHIAHSKPPNFHWFSGNLNLKSKLCSEGMNALNKNFHSISKWICIIYRLICVKCSPLRSGFLHHQNLFSIIIFANYFKCIRYPLGHQKHSKSVQHTPSRLVD